MADLLFSLADSGSEKVFQFLETVELFDFEREIDRLVGDPRTLNDSTAYKLGLLPFHIRFPIYQQLVRQMTRQDDLRSRRIHQVTPDAVNVIALRIGALAEDDVREEVRASLTKHFNAREVADLGFFILAQQQFFPDTDEGWQHWKRAMADAGPAIAAAALMTGAAFDVASLSRSAPSPGCSTGACALGWYGGFRRLGMRFRPIFRAGLTLHMQDVEMAVGLSQAVRARPLDPDRALELAVRENRFNHLARAWGWDAFFEGAYRYVLQSSPGYEGEDQVARLGFFARRDENPRLEALRAALLGRIGDRLPGPGALRRRLRGGALGHRADHDGAGQPQRPSRRPTETGRHPRGHLHRRHDGAADPPVRGRHAQPQPAGVRRLGDDPHAGAPAQENERELARLGTPGGSLAAARAALAAIDRAMKEQEARLSSMEGNLASYLESRRLAYNLKRWPARQGDLHGPLAPEVLQPAREKVFDRLQELALQLQKSAERLQIAARAPPGGDGAHGSAGAAAAGDRGAGRVRGGTGGAGGAAAARIRARRGALQAYLTARECARRIKAASPRVLASRDDDPLPARDLRRVMALKTLTMPSLR